MSTHQYIRLEDTVYLYFASNNTSGSGDDGATPLFDVRLGGAAASDAPILSGTPDLLTHANYPAGAHEIAIAATEANGFIANATYGVFSTLLVDSQNPTGAVGSFITTPLATSEEVANVGSGSAGAVNIAAFEDNTSAPIIDGVTSVGTPTGTFANITNEDEVLMSIADVGNDIDWVFGYSVGGARTGASVSYVVNVNGNADSMLLTVYNHGTTNWDTIAVLNGTGGSSFISGDAAIFSAHTGTGSELGNVYVRFQNNATTPSQIQIDKCIVSAVNIGQSVGYDGGQIWVKTVGGTAGTEAYVNGTADNPVLTWADTKTLSASVGLTDFHIINGSTVTLDAASDNFSLFGDNWILELGGQSVADAYFQGARVSGMGTSANEVHYEGCEVATMSVQLGHFDFCSFSGTVTHTLTGDYNYHNCYSMVAGPGGPTFAKTAGQAVTVQFRGWRGSLNFTGLEATDTMTIGGDELGTIDLGSPAGAVVVEIRGIYKEITNIGSAVVNLDGAVKGSDVADTLADTNELQTDWSNGGRLDNILDARMPTAHIDATTGKVDGVATVDTTTTNTDMRGTDDSALAIVATEARLAELDAANLPTDVAAIDTKTTNLPPDPADQSIIIAATNALAVLINGLNDVAATDIVSGGAIDTTAGAVDTVSNLTNDVGITSTAIDDIWNEILTGATHNIPTSAGKILRILQEGGFSTASIWIDTSVASGGDGTVTDPTDGMTAALVIASATGFRRFEYVTGSSDTFASAVDGYCIGGFGYTIDLNGQSISGTRINNATLSGVCTGASAPEFRKCDFGNVTIPPCSIRSGSFGGDMIMSAGDYFFNKCFSAVAGISSPSFDFGAGGSTSLNMRHYSGGAEIKNMGVAGTDRMSLEGDGQLIINASCTGGTVAIRGHFTVTDNAGAVVTLSEDARFDVAQVENAVFAGGDIDTYTLEEAFKIILAAVAGKLSGAATATNVIRAADDSKPRITATVDAVGNRTAVTLDETG